MIFFLLHEMKLWKSQEKIIIKDGNMKFIQNVSKVKLTPF